MKRSVGLALLGTGLLLVGAMPGVGKKKQAKPIIQTFEATMLGGDALRFEIEEFSTDQDIQDLARAYAKGRYGGLKTALSKAEKGRYLIQHYSSSIRLVQSVAQQGGARTVSIVTDPLVSRCREYEFAYTQLRIDEKGRGVGQQVPCATIAFNKEGIIEIRSMTVPDMKFRLVDVHTVPR